MFILDGSQEEHETKADRESGVALQVSASIITNYFVVNNTVFQYTQKKSAFSSEIMSFRQSPLKRQDRKSDPKTTESESQVDDSFSPFKDDRSEYIS